MKIYQLSSYAIVFIFSVVLTNWSVGWCNTSSQQELSVTLSTPQRTYAVDEPIDLRVEIKNVGKEPFFIGQDIPTYNDWIYNLRLDIRNEKGEYSPVFSSNGPFVLPFDPKESVAHALSSRWTPLPPGYFYGTTIRISGSIFSFLQRPGKYVLSGAYKSSGMELPVQFNRLAASPEEIKRLPYRSWKGEAKTNSISIEITARGVNPQGMEFKNP